MIANAPIKPAQRDPNLCEYDPQHHHKNPIAKHCTMRHEEDLFLRGSGSKVGLVNVVDDDGADGDEFGGGGGGNCEE